MAQVTTRSTKLHPPLLIFACTPNADDTAMVQHISFFGTSRTVPVLLVQVRIPELSSTICGILLFLKFTAIGVLGICQIIVCPTAGLDKVCFEHIYLCKTAVPQFLKSPLICNYSTS